VKRSSTRYRDSFWTRYVVPGLLAVLLLALIGTVIFVILFAAGVI